MHPGRYSFQNASRVSVSTSRQSFGCSNLIYLDKNNKEEAERIFKIMMDLGVYEYFKLKGDIYTGNLIEKKYKKLFNELHLNITTKKHNFIPNAELIKEITRLNTFLNS